MPEYQLSGAEWNAAVLRALWWQRAAFVKTGCVIGIKVSTDT